MNWNKERKDSIFEAVSKALEMEQAKLAVLGAAKNKKNTGLNSAGKLFPPEKR